MDAVVGPEVKSGRTTTQSSVAEKHKQKSKDKDGSTTVKRRCVSTACVACRKRKSKCDGATPACMACASVYLTECQYDPGSDLRRRGVYKRDVDGLKTRNSTLQTLVEAILNYDEEEVMDLVHQIRNCESLEDLADSIVAKEKMGAREAIEEQTLGSLDDDSTDSIPKFDSELAGKMGDLVLEGSVRFVGGTSNLVWLPPGSDTRESSSPSHISDVIPQQRPPDGILSWTNVTKDRNLIVHLINLYFCWHYAYFTTLSKDLFYRDFLMGRPSEYCSPLLVNVMLSLGCHFTTWPAARADPDDSATVGDHFFQEAKRLMFENDEHANAKLCTVQALGLMSVREAGCGREGKGWVYSGMSIRMAVDIGLNVDAPGLNDNAKLGPEDIDARRITSWGVFLFDKCWSMYTGRQPILPPSNTLVPKPDVFPGEEAEKWSPYNDSGMQQTHNQPARTRAVALQISRLCEISSDLLSFFYNPSRLEKPVGKQQELKKLSEIHTRLETWKKELPKELDSNENSLPQVIVMHMFFQMLFIHLYRPFLKYTQATSPLPAHVSPRKYLTQSAAAISKLFRLYKRLYTLNCICNITVYFIHTALTVHLLNLGGIDDKISRRDFLHGIKHLEEIGTYWTCARRTVKVIGALSKRWNVDIPDEASTILSRIQAKWGSLEISTPAGTFSEASTVFDNGMPPAAVPLTTSVVLPSDQSTVSLPQMQNGLMPQLIDSPDDTSIPTRRSSGGMSLPPQSAAELNRLSSKYRSSTRLTKEQQDAWNAHQLSRLGAVSNTSAEAAREHNSNPAILFGGVDSLLEEPQEWWLRDSNLAMGFDNWNENIDLDSIFVDSGSLPYGNINGEELMGTTNMIADGSSQTMGNFTNGVPPFITGGTANGFPQPGQTGGYTETYYG